jgi:hypothetical protein
MLVRDAQDKYLERLPLKSQVQVLCKDILSTGIGIQIPVDIRSAKSGIQPGTGGLSFVSAAVLK